MNLEERKSKMNLEKESKMNLEKVVKEAIQETISENLDGSIYLRDLERAKASLDDIIDVIKRSPIDMPPSEIKRGLTYINEVLLDVQNDVSEQIYPSRGHRPEYDVSDAGGFMD